MNRWTGLLNVVQALAYIGLGAYLQSRWLPGAVLLWSAAGAQLAGGGLLLAGKGPRVARWASIAGLLVSGLILGLYLQVGTHIVQTFTPIGGRRGWALMAECLLALPWAIFIPLWQLIATRPSRTQGGATSAGVLLLLLAPSAYTLGTLQPDQVWPVQDGEAAVTWLYQSWRGDEPGAPPSGDEVILALTVVRDGKVLETRQASGPLVEALERVLPAEQPWHEDAGLTLDIVRSSTPIHQPPLGSPGVTPLRPGNHSLLNGARVRPTVAIWRKPASRNAMSGVSVPGQIVGAADHTVETDAWVASEWGVSRLDAGWSVSEPMTPESLRDSATAGARWMALNMGPDGTFMYKVKGPSGERGTGYNYPRHAGSSWFLARVATRTGDPVARDAALAAIAHAKSVSRTLPDGRAFVNDPKRRDGKAWVGTTALQLLALVELDVEPELAAAYAAFVASAVDEEGVVRGDLDVETGTWPDQPEVTYAQGQGLLALAIAERGGLPVSRELDRAISYVDGGYWPQPAARLGILDEHWMCIASVAVQQVRGEPAGLEVCTAYLADVLAQAPLEGGGLNPPSGPAGGLAEAFVARAEVDRRSGIEGPYMERARAYGQLLLAQQYRPTDIPMLGNAPRLLGAFRDRPWSLDVQVDAVQHVGCALLGVEQLLTGVEVAGAMP